MLQLITCYNSLKHWDIHGYITNDWFGIPVKWWDPAVVFGSIMVRELDFDIRDLDFMVNSGTFVGQLPKPQKSWALKYQILSNTIKQKIITYQLNIIKCHGLMTNKYTKDELTSSCWHCSHWTNVLRSARRALSQSCRWEAIPVSLSAPWRLEWLIKDQPGEPMSVCREMGWSVVEWFTKGFELRLCRYISRHHVWAHPNGGKTDLLVVTLWQNLAVQHASVLMNRYLHIFQWSVVL